MRSSQVKVTFLRSPTSPKNGPALVSLSCLNRGLYAWGWILEHSTWGLWSVFQTPERHVFMAATDSSF